MRSEELRQQADLRTHNAETHQVLQMRQAAYGRQIQCRQSAKEEIQSFGWSQQPRGMSDLYTHSAEVQTDIALLRVLYRSAAEDVQASSSHQKTTIRFADICKVYDL